MNELMKQLQQWANEGRYDWENGTFKWEGIYINNPPLAGWGVFVQLVLEGTIQVWRPVEHYPLKEDGEPILLWKKDIRNVILVAWSLEFGSCFTDCEWRDFRSQVIIENIKEYTHWQPLPQLI